MIIPLTILFFSPNSAIVSGMAAEEIIPIPQRMQRRQSQPVTVFGPVGESQIDIVGNNFEILSPRALGDETRILFYGQPISSTRAVLTDIHQHVIFDEWLHIAQERYIERVIPQEEQESLLTELGKRTYAKGLVRDEADRLKTRGEETLVKAVGEERAAQIIEELQPKKTSAFSPEPHRLRGRHRPKR